MPPMLLCPAASDRPAADASVAGALGAERFEKELLVERLLDVRAAMEKQLQACNPKAGWQHPKWRPCAILKRTE